MSSQNASGKSIYPKDTAGANLTKKVPIVSPKDTLAEVKKYVLSDIRKFKTINYIYVTDSEGKLAGVFSIRELYRHKPEIFASQIATKDLITVKPLSDQEVAANLALRKNIKSIPIINHQGEFLGVVPSDKILQILQKEFREDVLRSVGVSKNEPDYDNVLEYSLFKSFKNRIPWILIGLGGGVLVAEVIGLFEATLEQNVLLAAFIPLIVYISNAVGMQVQTLFIRDLASQSKIPFVKYMLRQIFVSLLIATVSSAIILLVSLLGIASPRMGLIIALSMFVAINTAVILGMIFPAILNKLKKDPAVGSGPLVTIVQDGMSVVIYFGIASLLL